jgi:hypothetical protein
MPHWCRYGRSQYRGDPEVCWAAQTSASDRWRAEWRPAQDGPELAALLGRIRTSMLPRRSRRTAPCRRSGSSPGNQSGGAHIISPMGGSPSSEPPGAQPAVRCDPSFETSEVGPETSRTATVNTTLTTVLLRASNRCHGTARQPPDAALTGSTVLPGGPSEPNAGAASTAASTPEAFRYASANITPVAHR